LNPEISYNLADPRERSRLLADPGIFLRECEGLPRKGRMQQVFVDEVQTVPELFDAVQMLYDQDKHRWKCVLCGSSARKLRSLGTNLLPGRSVLHRLFPLVLRERPSYDKQTEEIIELPDTEMTAPFPGNLLKNVFRSSNFLASLC
jgi:predicted AAA+ superfamily ATPase